MDGTYERYLQALTHGDPVAALSAVREAQNEGESVEDVVRNVIIRSQDAAGRLWMSGEWGVADEHAATGVAEQVLAMFAPPERSDEADHLVLLACAEGEWHTFPSRLAQVLAHHPRLRLLSLGGSISASHLSAYLANARPQAVALSVTLSANLVGAARSIRAAREAGVPVIAGGAAWGLGQKRARALGAVCRVENPVHLGDTVLGLPGPGMHTEDLPEITLEVALLERPPHDLLAEALEKQRATSPWMRHMTPRQEQQTLDDLAWMARHAAAAVLCDDATIVRDLYAWLLELLVPRGVPATVVLDSALFLADTVEDLAPAGAAILRAEAIAAALTQPQEPTHV